MAEGEAEAAHDDSEDGGFVYLSTGAATSCQSQDQKEASPLPFRAIRGGEEDGGGAGGGGRAGDCAE